MGGPQHQAPPSRQSYHKQICDQIAQLVKVADSTIDDDVPNIPELDAADPILSTKGVGDAEKSEGIQCAASAGRDRSYDLLRRLQPQRRADIMRHTLNWLDYRAPCSERELASLAELEADRSQRGLAVPIESDAGLELEGHGLESISKLSLFFAKLKAQVRDSGVIEENQRCLAAAKTEFLRSGMHATEAREVQEVSALMEETKSQRQRVSQLFEEIDTLKRTVSDLHLQRRAVASQAKFLKDVTARVAACESHSTEELAMLEGTEFWEPVQDALEWVRTEGIQKVQQSCPAIADAERAVVLEDSQRTVLKSRLAELEKHMVDMRQGLLSAALEEVNTEELVQARRAVEQLREERASVQRSLSEREEAATAANAALRRLREVEADLRRSLALAIANLIEEGRTPDGDVVDPAAAGLLARDGRGAAAADAGCWQGWSDEAWLEAATHPDLCLGVIWANSSHRDGHAHSACGTMAAQALTRDLDNAPLSAAQAAALLESGNESIFNDLATIRDICGTGKNLVGQNNTPPPLPPPTHDLLATLFTEDAKEINESQHSFREYCQLASEAVKIDSGLELMLQAPASEQVCFFQEEASPKDGDAEHRIVETIDLDRREGDRNTELASYPMSSAASDLQDLLAKARDLAGIGSTSRLRGGSRRSSHIPSIGPSSARSSCSDLEFTKRGVLSRIRSASRSPANTPTRPRARSPECSRALSAVSPVSRSASRAPSPQKSSLPPKLPLKKSPLSSKLASQQASPLGRGTRAKGRPRRPRT